MYAVIATGGKQYRVSEGDVIFVFDVPDIRPDMVPAVNDST